MALRGSRSPREHRRLSEIVATGAITLLDRPGFPCIIHPSATMPSKRHERGGETRDEPAEAFRAAGHSEDEVREALEKAFALLFAPGRTFIACWNNWESISAIRCCGSSF